MSKTGVFHVTLSRATRSLRSGGEARRKLQVTARYLENEMWQMQVSAAITTLR